MHYPMGRRIKKLKRIRILNINLGKLKLGEYRKLSKQEIIELKKNITYWCIM